VGVAFLDGRLDASQWLGFGVVLTSVVALALHENRAEKPVVTAEAFAPDALTAARGPS
jgi:hypothetical protein